MACARPDPAAAPAQQGAASPQPPARPASDSPERSAPAAPEPARPAEPAPPAPTSSPAPLVYRYGRPHSPLSAGVVQQLRRVAARNPELEPNVFAKVGDSVTESPHALACFARGPDELGEHTALAAVIEFFRGGDAAGSNPFARSSRAAHSGWSAWQALAYDAPLRLEVEAIAPRYALVQFGTNDVQIGSLHFFADRLWDIADWLQARGVIPIFFTIMPRFDATPARQRVAWYNAAIRAVAAAQHTPLVDLHGALSALPGGGLASDGIHPSVYRGARGPDACALTRAGLRYGFNVRNLLALEALDRVRRVLTELPALDDPEPLPGSGSAEDPFVVRQLPLVSARSIAGTGNIERYEGCGAERATPGPEHWYRIELDRPRTLRVIGFDRDGAELDLVLLGKDGDPRRCLASGRRSLLASVPAGSYRLVIDAVHMGSAARSARYAVALLDG